VEIKHPIKKLDFPDRDITIIVNTDIEFIYRARACAKEPFTVDWIRDTAHNGVFYDVGANVGSYSLIAASIMAEDNGVVVSFEPAYFNFYKLCENISINKFNKRIIPLNVALTNTNMLLDMHFADTRFGSSNNLSDAGSSVFTTVLGIRLDDAVENYGIPFPNHIKIDVDGSEESVLEGGKRTFHDNRLQSVMIEVNNANPEECSHVYQFMADAGFVIRQTGQLISKNLSNVLFARS
jgi:FkbM family methyltransferase